MTQIITDSVHAILEPKRKRWPVHSNRASALDDPCARRLVYYRTQHDKARQVPIYLQGIFETGNTLEPIIQRILSEAGMAAKPQWRIIGEQMEVQDEFFKKHNITGHIDGLLQFHMPDTAWKTESVCDIKTCSANIFPRLNCYDDLALYPWTRKWRGQLYLYALGLNIDKCLLVLVNKQNLYEIKSIEFELDYEYAERLVKKAETINYHVRSKTLPEKINQPETCGQCEFAHICLPDLEINEGMELSDSVELAELLKERADCQPFKRQFDAIEKRLKGILKPGQDTICGDYLILWKQIKKVMAAKPRTEIEYWQKKVLPTKPDGKGD